MDDDGTCHGVLTRSIATVVPRASQKIKQTVAHYFMFSILSPHFLE